jgi:hypothetical protein
MNAPLIKYILLLKNLFSGEIKPERIDESFQRIVQLKSRIGNKDIPAYKAEIAKLQDQLNKQQTEKIQEVVVTEPQSKEEPEVKKKKRKRNQ